MDFLDILETIELIENSLSSFKIQGKPVASIGYVKLMNRPLTAGHILFVEGVLFF